MMKMTRRMIMPYLLILTLYKAIHGITFQWLQKAVLTAVFHCEMLKAVFSNFLSSEPSLSHTQVVPSH
jgi:hypothetical protein